MIWKEKLYREDQFNLLKGQGVAELFCSLIANRNFEHIKKKSDIKTLIDSPFDLIEPPEALENIELAMRECITAGGHDVVVFGDYDVDGIVSSYMFEKLMRELHASSVDVYLPSRTSDGYGLNDRSVENFIKICKKPYALVAILDCGSSSRKHIEKIRAHLPDARCIVIDHHIIEPENFSSNADAVVNPRMNDATPYCTGGLVFQLARKCGEEAIINVPKYMPYAALTTIADVCELTGTNRVIVKNGLRQLNSCTDVGLSTLFKVADVSTIDCNSEDIAFRIAPMINASGRMTVASDAYKVFMSEDIEQAKVSAKHLKSLNEDRKKIQKEAAVEAISIFDADQAGKSSALLYKENWNPSIVGIVASKISETYNVPTICFGNYDGKIKGSARSIEGVNIKEIMDSCSEIFIAHGGHEMAAGAELDPAFIDTAWEIFDKKVKEYLEAHNIGEPSISYDCELSPDLMLRVNDVFCERLAMLEPYGPGNPTPIFRANGLQCNRVKEWGSGTGAFVHFDNTGLNSVAYGKGIKKRLHGKTVDVLFSINRSFLDEEDWHMRIIDFKQDNKQ
jgi:single-stranded-DNA-specific exonuclease